MLVPKDATSLLGNRGSRSSIHVGTAPGNESGMWGDSPSTIRLASCPLGTAEGTDLLTAAQICREPISQRGWTLHCGIPRLGDRTGTRSSRHVRSDWFLRRASNRSNRSDWDPNLICLDPQEVRSDLLSIYLIISQIANRLVPFWTHIQLPEYR